jgi:hypothetical protein
VKSVLTEIRRVHLDFLLTGRRGELLFDDLEWRVYERVERGFGERNVPIPGQASAAVQPAAEPSSPPASESSLARGTILVSKRSLLDDVEDENSDESPRCGLRTRRQRRESSSSVDGDESTTKPDGDGDKASAEIDADVKATIVEFFEAASCIVGFTNESESFSNPYLNGTRESRR